MRIVWNSQAGHGANKGKALVSRPLADDTTPAGFDKVCQHMSGTLYDDAGRVFLVDVNRVRFVPSALSTRKGIGYDTGLRQRVKGKFGFTYRQCPESQFPAVRAFLVDAMKAALAQVVAVDWDSKAAGWPDVEFPSPRPVAPQAQGVDLSKPDLPARPSVTVDDFPPAVARVDVSRPWDGRSSSLQNQQALGTAPQVRRDNAEWHAGRDARAAGEPLEACPYSAGGERAARWDLGWREASPSHRRCGAVHAIGRHLEAIRALVDGPLGEPGPTNERTADGLESILEALEGVKVKAQALRDGRPLSPLWIVDGAGDYRAGPYDTWAAADSALAMLRMDRKPDADSLRVDGGR